MDHVIGAGVRGVSKSIAVVSEVVAGRRHSKTSQTQIDEKANNSDSDSDEDILAREQDLDDAIGDDEDQAEIEKDTHSPQDVANSFINDFQNSLPAPAALRPLPQSVILPQRRPRDRARGFIRAYAPILNECSGIDQATFMKFLLDWDKAAKAWPIFNVINIAAFGIGMVPHVAFMAASTAMSIAADVGEELQTRYQTNDYMDKINEALFKPRKLYALIMTYQPDMSDDALLRADVTNPHSVALSKALSRDGGNKLKKTLSRFSSVSSGTTKHDSQMLDPAPLIYPALDRALLTNPDPNSTSTSTSNQLTTTPSRSSIVQDYLDRRAQASFAAQNKNSTLTSTLPPQETKFVNRYADPDHPVNSGSIFGLVTGGTFDPIANGRVRRASRKAKRKGEPPLTAEEKHDAYMGRKVRDRVTGTPSKEMLGLKRFFAGSVLYLVITNLPEGVGVGEGDRVVR